MCPDEKGGERSADRWREASVALHLMHLFVLRFVSCQSAKGRNHASMTQTESLMWFHLPAGMLPSSVKT